MVSFKTVATRQKRKFVIEVDYSLLILYRIALNYEIKV